MKHVVLVVLLGVLFGLGACSFAGAEGQSLPGDGGTDGTDGMDGDGDGGTEDTDGDGDGVGDGVDNCPRVSNPKKDTLGLGLVQRDHDSDGRGDECDLCPHIKDEPNVDVDLDGIGAACDPSDAVKNPPAEFNGFYDAPVATDWNIPAGAGALSDWELTQADGRLWWKQKAPDVGRHQLLRNLPAFREVYVDSIFRIHDISPAAGANVLRSAAITYGFLRARGSDYYFNCGARRDTDNQTNSAISASYQNDGVLDVRTGVWAGELPNRDIHVVGESVLRPGGGGGDSRLLCGANASPDNAITVDPQDNQRVPDGQVGLRTYGMTASFDYLFLVNKAAAATVAR
jgi:hypothetical protein